MNAPFKIIVWCHNYLYADFCKYIVQNESVKAYVFVGKQQYDMYVDIAFFELIFLFAIFSKQIFGVYEIEE